MSDPYLGEVKIISFNFAPKGWAFCNGQLLSISQNQALFSLLGTTYGGNGQTTFALPDLQGRSPLHFGNGVSLGERSGQEAHTLTAAEMPAHSHPPRAASNAADATSPIGNVWATTGAYTAFAASPDEAMATGLLSSVGGDQPHPNLSPYLVLNFVIALIGIFPSRS
jgi:microcystin-dependent protein